MNDMSWDLLRLFYRVAVDGGLPPASRATGVSAPTIGRRMRDLEAITGRSLFVRQQTGYLLTSDGKDLFQHVMSMHLAAQNIQDWKEDVLDLPMVSISAGTWMSRYLATSISKLRAANDPFRLRFKSSEARLDIDHREVDIGIRNKEPVSGNLAAQRTVRVCYAPYRAMRIESVDDASWVAISKEAAIAPSARWPHAQAGLWITAAANTPAMLLDLIQGGAGQGLLPCFVGDRHPELARSGPIIDDLSHHMWVVMHDDERRRPEVRTVIDRLVGAILQDAPVFSGEA